MFVEQPTVPSPPPSSVPYTLPPPCAEVWVLPATESLDSPLWVCTRLQAFLRESSSDFSTSRGKSENSVRGELSLSSGGGVRSEAIIVSDVPGGTDSVNEVRGRRTTALACLSLYLETRRSRYGIAGRGLRSHPLVLGRDGWSSAPSSLSKNGAVPSN